MSQRVTIYGGSGFVGRYIAKALAEQGWQVTTAVRRPDLAGFLKTYGAPKQVQAMYCNISDDASVREAAKGADVVINCVGTFDARGPNNFKAVQAQGATRIAEAAKALEIGHMVHISAIGANRKGPSDYAKTKAAGEAGVLENMPGATVLRPSVIFGPEDQFFNRFAEMARMGPTVPVVGAATKFQPVFVGDVAAAAAKGAADRVAGTFELGGPDVATFHDLMKKMLSVIERRRLVLDIPIWAGGLIAAGADLGSRVSGGLLPTPITPDQVKSLGKDNVVAEGALGLSDLGITPTSMDEVIPEYLAKFRPNAAPAAA